MGKTKADDVESNIGGVTGKGFKPGQSGFFASALVFFNPGPAPALLFGGAL